MSSGSENIKPDSYLDATGFLCPMPVLRTRKTLENLQNGQVLAVEASDAKARKDIPLFCEQAGHNVIAFFDHGERFIFLIQKSGD